MNAPIKTAVIGCGRFSRTPLGNLKKHTELFELTGVADIDAGAARETARQWGIGRWETDGARLIDDPDVEAILVLTPALAHAEPTIRALRAGKHVFCEKPMARRTADARAMAAAARDAGRVLQVGYVMRHSPDAQNLRRLIREGRIGRPVFYRDIWALAKGNPSPSTHDARLGGGIIYEHAHWLDFVAFVFGPPAKVYAATMRLKPDLTTADDTFILIVDFASGDRAVWSESWAARGMGWDVMAVGRKVRPTLDVIGPKGSIHFPSPAGERILSLYESADQNGTPTEQWAWEQDWGANSAAYEGELIDFYRCVREGLSPCPTPDEAVTANVLAEAAFESSRTGEPVYLEV
ncbi:MAG: Gfo/Idh/MocA family oxidoreductase [bacterium]|nr:Gfo/Idh/MocA family oxidoreductase [bacterium]